ncbi:hypothetical protein QLY92_15560 [Cronobacter dublinensis]|uniref:glycoside hydrolase family 19 protein n=1 Tax=Cronobacter dublinensis TaxID=413497 RepID=UPI0024AEBC10|nr:hypothetical protein [Cronobacter dublinensis]MDI7493497.1 hypothetical protein [Cronobacter dublinensis]
MDIRYPVRKADGRDYKSYNELLTDICKNAHGLWLLGVNRYWHGGIHIGASSSPASVLNQDMPEKSVPLQFMMDGEVVAWRVNRDYANIECYQERPLRQSGTFVLVKSVYKPDEQDESSWLTLYQLYMHTAPLSEYPKRSLYRVTQKGHGVRMRKHSCHDDSREIVPDVLENKHGHARTLLQGDTLAVLQQKSFLLKQQPEPFALVQRLQDGKPAGEPFWISMRPEFLEPDGECYVCLPDWMHSALNHGVFDDVVVPSAPLKVTVKAGEPVGFLGAQDLTDEDTYPQTITTEYKAHIELLSLDEHVPDVVANVKGIKTGKQFIKLKLKRPLYLRKGRGDESTFEQMSVITLADAGKIIPRDATSPFIDKTGTTYFQIRPHTWMHQDDVEQLNQHDLAGLNFYCIKAEPTTDFTRTLDERWLTEALKSINSHFDSAKGPQFAQAKMFYESLIRRAGNRRPPKLYPDISDDEQLFGALHSNQMNIPEYARRLIVKHDSEWDSSPDDTRWASVFNGQEESHSVTMANSAFLEATRWINKVPPFASQRAVWHFHPLEFLEAINPKRNCACGRDITLDELCDIAPKADKDVLAQYLPAFNDGFREFGILSCREKAHFLAQCCHESGGLTLTKEIGGARASYAPWYGRGLIQLTWQDLYKKYGAYVGEDFESDDAARNKIAQHPDCVRSAFWFYCVNKNVSQHAKNDDFNMVTALINGGFNGYNNRLQYFNRAVSIFKAEHHNLLKKEAGFSFEDSEIYNYRVYAYSWGRYHDPLRNESGTDKDKMEALKAYRRAVTLYEQRGDTGTVTDIKSKINALG